MSPFEFDPKRYPTQPGCYLMIDRAGRVIYVGKAKNLRRRLSTYFGSRRKRRRMQRLVARIADVEIILVNNETESLILENNLIKQHKPRYNRMLVSDNSGYAYIVLTAEDLPRFVPYRKHRINREWEDVHRNGSARRFGPYVSGRFAHTLLHFVIENFRIRTYKRIPQRACLSYHLGICGGICEQKLSAEEYAEAVNHAVAFLSQGHASVVRQMRSRMWECAGQLQFEKAKRIRDQIEALERVLETQIVERDVDHDQDVVFFGESKVLVTQLTRGAIRRLIAFDLDLTGGHAAACERFLVSHYAEHTPAELIVNRLQNQAKVKERLAAANGNPVKINLPGNGVEHALLQLCERNYAYRVSLEE